VEICKSLHFVLLVTDHPLLADHYSWIVGKGCLKKDKERRREVENEELLSNAPMDRHLE